MTHPQEASVGTLLEAIQKSLFAAGRHAPGEVAPVAILWPDPDMQWSGLIPQLRHLMPELIVLGPFAPKDRQGPAIWLRCMIERVLVEPSLPENRVPIIYMPKISRQILRTVDECPDNLKPLVELQHRGIVWCQRNGRDWTVEAFMVSEESGLGLDVAKDNATRRAMAGALPQLAVASLFRLRGKRLEAEDFDRLMVEDTPRNLLEWLSEPKETRARWDDGRWTAFCSRCKAEYGFDPEKDGELVAGEAGFIVAYPSGTGRGPFLTWNAGGFARKAEEGRADDVAYLGKVLDDLATVVNVDPKQVFACGISNGGMMCYRLAAEMSITVR